jgi:hypothetical protein
MQIATLVPKIRADEKEAAAELGLPFTFRRDTTLFMSLVPSV